MRPKILLICGIVFAFCLWLLLYQADRHQKNLENKNNPVAANQPNQLQTPQQSDVAAENFSKSIATSAASQSAPNTNHAATEGQRRQFIANWQTPINFYGKVVDENTNPVEGASISFHWVESPMKDAPNVFETKSDDAGLFSLERQRGPTLEVSVSKDGYYTSRKDRTGFSYGNLAPGKFSPSIFDPVIFHLHKKGQGADLVTSQYGIRTDFPVLVSRDGNPVNIDLLQRKIDASADLQISQVKPDSAHWNSATNWSFHMKLSDGGFIETDDAFLFTAPETGYQSTVDLDFTKGEDNWTTQFTKTYYVVFGQPQRYGWLQVDANMSQQTIVLKYAINPAGAQNLEPK
jgi:hypothetical protein